MPPMGEADPVQNVVIFGESGVGKSSIVNLVLGSQVAKTSPDADACTTRTRSYDVLIHGKRYRLWDTPGLDGGSFGLFQAAIAERRLKMSLRNLFKKDEPPLLLYCVRASRATHTLVRHYQSVRLSAGDTHVPMAIVVTGLENAHEDMENWWYRNAAELSNHGMEFIDHACITSIDDNPRDLELARTRRVDSQEIVRDLIFRSCVPLKPHEQCDSTRYSSGGQNDTRGAVWTYLVSTLLSSRR